MFVCVVCFFYVCVCVVCFLCAVSVCFLLCLCVCFVCFLNVCVCVCPRYTLIYPLMVGSSSLEGVISSPQSLPLSPS